MRVGTITYHQANNYGAVLQAYALQKYMVNMGVATEIIDYHPKKGLSTEQHSFINKIMYYLFKANVYRSNKITQRKFNDFRKKHLKISSTSFFGDEQISNNPPFYDLYIVGSDQIWNTNISNKSKAYFLNFVKSGRRVSYAASLGKSEFNETEKEYAKEYLSTFDAISVRESLLQQKLKTEFSICAEHVLDPIFLLDKENWIKIAGKTRLPKKYVLCYMMEYSQELIDHTKDVAKQLNCTPIFISPSHSNFLGEKIKGLGPSEFIYTLANASYICTNSFHGTAFSIIFEKNFTVFKHSKLNSRLESIIDISGLNSRFYDASSEKIELIDYKAVNEKMKAQIIKSKQFIVNVLGNRNNLDDIIIKDGEKNCV